VDDTPETLALLHDKLEESGYTVLVATNGKTALKICQEMSPDVVLLDAVMPEMDGFSTCKFLKSDHNTSHIPVIFMTGLTESEHVVAGFAAGGTDYVTKPLNHDEVIARVERHVGNARLMSRTQSAFDVFGQAAIALLPDSYKIIWQTPLSKQLLKKYLNHNDDQPELDMSFLKNWIDSLKGDTQTATSYKVKNESGILVFTAADLNSDEQLLVLLKEEKSESSQIEALRELFNLTKRESEVLYWATLGKTDKLIGEILGTSPRTVNKHMEHVLVKLDVESRTAAATLVSSTIK
jgi:DNA-binding response OmpR family regulator/DNA-binding CsgD family transcriptional regulator